MGFNANRKAVHSCSNEMQSMIKKVMPISHITNFLGISARLKMYDKCVRYQAIGGKME